MKTLSETILAGEIECPHLTLDDHTCELCGAEHHCNFFGSREEPPEYEMIGDQMLNAWDVLDMRSASVAETELLRSRAFCAIAAAIKGHPDPRLDAPAPEHICAEYVPSDPPVKTWRHVMEVMADLDDLPVDPEEVIAWWNGILTKAK